jgi:hypothetical protein
MPCTWSSRCAPLEGWWRVSRHPSRQEAAAAVGAVDETADADQRCQHGLDLRQRATLLAEARG